jgi:hypothetical protein
MTKNKIFLDKNEFLVRTRMLYGVTYQIEHL